MNSILKRISDLTDEDLNSIFKSKSMMLAMTLASNPIATDAMSAITAPPNKYPDSKAIYTPEHKLSVLRQLLKELNVEFTEDTTDQASLIRQHTDALMAIVQSSTDMTKQDKAMVVNVCFQKISVNKPCPCGSSIKYKKCCKL
jgi:uncharacterized protein YchJ